MPISYLHNNMNLNRPDLTQVGIDVRNYIEALEAEVKRLQGKDRKKVTAVSPDEPPTTQNLITVTADGVAKRTPRHLYPCQKRSGMGIFDLDTPETDPPIILCLADEADIFLVFTNFGRAFRLPVTILPATPVRSKGESLAEKLNFRPQEKVIAVLPSDVGDYVALVSERGWVQRVRKNYLGKGLLPGMSFHNIKNGGFLTGACWSAAEEDLLIVTRAGKGIRFAGRLIHSQGNLGLRVDVDDTTVGITAVSENSDVFIIGHDGKGSIRMMSGFRANKAPGAGGKVVLKTERLIAAITVQTNAELFIITQSGKIIRFQASEVPPKEGVVQGVNCMTLRNDIVSAVTTYTPLS